MASRIAAGIVVFLSVACGTSADPVSVEADGYSSKEQLVLAGDARRTIESEAAVDFDGAELRDGECVIEIVDDAKMRTGAQCNLERDGLKLRLTYLYGQADHFPGGLVISASGSWSDEAGAGGTFVQTRILSRSSKR